MEIITKLLRNSFEEMVEIRRYLHTYPELSFQEVQTPKYIANYLRNLGLEVRERVGGRGVVAKLYGGRPGRTVALRADFDALAIQEHTNVPYKSKIDGVMHACGHDGHTAVLLTLAKCFVQNKDRIDGNIVFIFQHAEEIAPGGAISMIEDGCLEGVDVIFGQHLWAPMALGEIGVNDGAIMAAADRFEIIIEGKGGHGAEPHHAIDPIVIASQFVVQIQTILSRRIDPLKSAVISIGSIEAINPFNVIAQDVKIYGTVRTFNEDLRENIIHLLEKNLKGVCLANDASYKFHYFRGYPPVVNHLEETRLVQEAAQRVQEVSEVKEIPPMMIGEDFAYYLQKVPGSFFLVGAKDPSLETVYPHHHSKFNFDERAMLIAANVLANATYNYLNTYQNN